MKRSLVLISLLLAACAAPLSASQDTAVATPITAQPSTGGGTPPLPTPTRTPIPTVRSPTPLPSSTRAFTPSIPTPTDGPPTATPTITPFPPDRPPSHFWLRRPIPEGYVDWVARTYTYGSTRNGEREPHHGVEFVNPVGTPLVAAADGEVVVAGTDWDVVYGPDKFFYGNLIVIRLDPRYLEQPVYLLYGHVDRIDVQVGQQVGQGDAIGTVGATGVAEGAHLHFEVRVGQNNYLSTRNPELWLAPYRGWGTLAGRVVGADGRFIPEVTLTLKPLEIKGDWVIGPRYFTTYTQESLNPDDELRENFVTSDLPPGVYEISLRTTRSFKQTVEIKPDSLAWVQFDGVPPPPPPTLTPAVSLTKGPTATP